MAESLTVGAERHKSSSIFAVLVAASAAYLFTSLMIFPAVGEIVSELQTTPAMVSWLLTAPLLVGVVVPPIAGRLSDMFGKPQALVATLAVFTFGGLVAGLGAVSHSMALLIAGRALQGFGAATFPLSFGVIRDVYPKDRVGPALSLLSSSLGLGAGLGLVLAGPIMSGFGWDWLFWAGALVVALTLIAALYVLPFSKARSPGRIDWLGAVLLSIGLAVILLVINRGSIWGWGSAAVLSMLGVGVLFLLGLVAWEKRASDPLVDLSLVNNRASSATNFEAFIVGLVQFGFMSILPLFVRTPETFGFGFSADVTASGLFMLPSMVAVILIAPIGSLLSKRFGARVQLGIGALLLAAGFLWIALKHSTYIDVYGANAVFGAGLGLALGAVATLVVQSVDASKTGAAAGLNTVFRMIGGAVGTQLGTAIVAANIISGTTVPAEQGYSVSFAAFCIASLMVIGTAMAVSRAKADAG